MGTKWILKNFLSPNSLLTMRTATGYARVLVIKPSVTMIYDLLIKCQAYFLPANYVYCFDSIAKVFRVISATKS